MVLSPSKILSGGGKIEDVYAKLKELEENCVRYFTNPEVIETITNTNNSDKELIYTAEENCWFTVILSAKTDGQYTAVVFVDGKIVLRNENSFEIQGAFPLKKGQEIRKTNGNATFYIYRVS